VIGQVPVQDKSQVFIFDGEALLHPSCVADPEFQVRLCGGISDSELFKLLVKIKK
jgi:hypothetical protein